MIKSNVDIHRDLLNTVKRGIERIENNQCTDLADLEKTLKVMASVCAKAAENINQLETTHA